MIRDNKPNVVWTADLVSQVTYLWRKGVPAKDIAKQVRCGTSKNSIIGKMHRLDIDPGLPPSGRTWHQPTRKAPAKAAKAPPAASLPLPVPEPPPPPPPVPRPPPRPRPKPPAGWTLLDLGSDQCKWPLNSPERGGEYVFCGLPIAEAGCSYCREHVDLGFSGKGTARRAELGGWQPRQAGF